MPATFKKNNIVIEGRNFFYWEKNQNHKETAILLHGFPGSHRGMVDMARFLDQYHLILPDLPGCGLSVPLSHERYLKDYAIWLDMLMETLSIKKTMIIGHSFGSRIALVFCADYPKKVSRLVLITPIVEVSGFLARLGSLYYKVAKLFPGYLQRKIISSKYYKEVADIITFKSHNHALHKKIIDTDIEELKHLDLKTHLEVFDEYYKASLLPIAKRVTVPSLIIAGRQDEIAPLHSVQKLADQLPHGKLIIMENAGHFLPLEKPLVTANVVISWLAP